MHAQASGLSGRPHLWLQRRPLQLILRVSHGVLQRGPRHRWHQVALVVACVCVRERRREEVEESRRSGRGGGMCSGWLTRKHDGRRLGSLCLRLIGRLGASAACGLCGCGSLPPAVLTRLACDSKPASAGPPQFSPQFSPVCDASLPSHAEQGKDQCSPSGPDTSTRSRNQPTPLPSLACGTCCTCTCERGEGGVAGKL